MTSYSIHFKTTRGDGSYGVSELFKTDSFSHARRALTAVNKALGATPKGRAKKRIEIISVDNDRLRVFIADKLWYRNLIRIFLRVRFFDSTAGFANAIGANPTAIRIALLKARSNGEDYATVRGITFKYAPNV
jgi:hypothetical protein